MHGDRSKTAIGTASNKLRSTRRKFDIPWLSLPLFHLQPDPAEMLRQAAIVAFLRAV